MKTIYTYYKNSNTGELMQSQEFKEAQVEHPVTFYDIKNKTLGENLSLKGFVKISEKTWKRYKRKK